MTPDNQITVHGKVAVRQQFLLKAEMENVAEEAEACVCDSPES